MRFASLFRSSTRVRTKLGNITQDESRESTCKRRGERGSLAPFRTQPLSHASPNRVHPKTEPRCSAKSCHFRTQRMHLSATVFPHKGNSYARLPRRPTVRKVAYEQRNHICRYASRCSAGFCHRWINNR